MQQQGVDVQLDHSSVPINLLYTQHKPEAHPFHLHPASNTSRDLGLYLRWSAASFAFCGETLIHNR